MQALTTIISSTLNYSTEIINEEVQFYEVVGNDSYYQEETWRRMEEREYQSISEAQWEVFQVEFIGVIMVLLRNLCLSVIFQQNYHKPIGFVIEFVTLVFPMLFCLTIFSENLSNLIFSILLICTILALIQVWLDRPMFFLSRTTDFLSYFRNSMFIGTAVAILACDFNIFPSRFGKTISYGLSVMDIGTAMFVMSMALSEYLMAHRPPKVKPIRTKPTPFYFSTFVILIGIGVTKELFSHFFNYSHSAIEYGEHWNFFITLAFLKLYITLFPYPYSMPLGIVIGLVYQTALNLGLEPWLLRDERDSWNVFDSNREGICSLFGYIFEYSITLIIIKFIATVDGMFNPSYKSAILCLISAAFTYFSQLLVMEVFGDPSRRIANIPYVLAMISMKFGILGFFQLIQLQGALRSTKNNIDTLNTKSINLLEAISGNSLWFFLIANLGTGLVNSITSTHSIDNIPIQMAILISYNFVICLIIYLWHFYRNRKIATKNNSPILNVIIE